MVRLVLLALGGGFLLGLPIPTEQSGNAIMCYYGSWAVYRFGKGKFDVENIDPFLCTHLVYGFAGLDRQTYTIRVLDPYNDLEENWGRGAYKRFTGLKKINPGLKTLLAIGGWNEGFMSYSEMVSDPSKRKAFIESVLKLLLKHDFDGLDFDWEYPGGRNSQQSLPNDKENMVLLLREIKKEFSNHGLLLTAAVSASKVNIDTGYDVPALSDVLDYINVMAYDFHGWWGGNRFTGHHSPLYRLPQEEDPNHPFHNFNADFAISYWIELGAKKEKLLLGIGAYGRGFTLANESDSGFYAPAIDGIVPGRYTRTRGFWGFNEFCEEKRTEEQIWKTYRDPNVVSPYSVNGPKWIGYDDGESLKAKAKYILEKAIGGGMVWSVETDDFHGICNGVKNPLLRALRQELLGDLSSLPNRTIESTTSPGTAETAEDVCKGSTGMKKDETDCSKYYNCIVGSGDQIRALSQSCPQGLLFNTETLSCDWPMAVECDDEPPVAIAEEDLGPGTTKAPLTQAELEEESTENGETSNECETEGLFESSETSCGSYYVCNVAAAKGFSKTRCNCRFGLQFNGLTKTCEWPSKKCAHEFIRNNLEKDQRPGPQECSAPIDAKLIALFQEMMRVFAATYLEI